MANSCGTEFVNRSDKPLYALKIHGFRAKVVEGQTAVLMSPIEKIHPEGDPRCNSPLTFPGTARYPELAAGARVRTLWAADENAGTSTTRPGYYALI